MTRTAVEATVVLTSSCAYLLVCARLTSQLEHLEDFMNDTTDPIQPYRPGQ